MPLVAPSGAHILPHHPGILMLKDVTVIHKGVFPRRGLIKGNEKFCLILDESHVLPTRQVSRRWRARQRVLVGAAEPTSKVGP